LTSPIVDFAFSNSYRNDAYPPPGRTRAEGQKVRLNDQQFLAVVGAIIVALIAYLSYERFRECQDLGESHCYFGRRLPPGRAG